MRVKTSARSKLLFVITEGEFTLDEAKRTLIEVIKAVNENGSEKVLFDGRTISGEPTVIERYFFGEFAAYNSLRANRGVQFAKAPKFAFLLHQPVLDPHRLGETVAINRGMNVKAFDNLLEAAAWLGLDRKEVNDLTHLNDTPTD
jgi:hypothetical protein